MKFRHLVLLCTAAALPQLATADLAVTDPAGLAEVHALLDFCSQFDSKNSASFKAEWQSIVGDQSSLLAQIEQNPKYKQGYAAFTSELLKLPRGQTLAICTVSAARWNGTQTPDKNADPVHPGDHDRDH